MGRQIEFLQTINDIQEFIELCNGMQLNIFLRNGSRIKVASEIKHGQQVFLSKYEAVDGNDCRVLHRSTIEYDVPNLYRKESYRDLIREPYRDNMKEPQKDIISNGRLWIDSEADKVIMDQYNKLVRWIRKKYTRFNYYYWFAPDVIEEVRKGKLIAATNMGSMQIVDKNFNDTSGVTWLSDPYYQEDE